MRRRGERYPTTAPPVRASCRPWRRRAEWTRRERHQEYVGLLEQAATYLDGAAEKLNDARRLLRPGGSDVATARRRMHEDYDVGQLLQLAATLRAANAPDAHEEGDAA